jgi:hypothetical protein
MSEPAKPVKASALLEDPLDNLPGQPAPTKRTGSKIIHFLEDGFTALENTWYRGQELEIEYDSELWMATCDRNGENSWMLLTPQDQIRKYGKVIFAEGPWPFDDYDDEAAKEAERARARKPPINKPGFVAGPRN